VIIFRSTFKRISRQQYWHCNCLHLCSEYKREHLIATAQTVTLHFSPNLIVRFLAIRLLYVFYRFCRAETSYSLF